MVPPIDYYLDFFAYVQWADLQQLQAGATLSDSAWFHNHGWSFGSIHRVLLHGIAAQDVWLLRFTNQPTRWLMDDPAYAARASLEPAMRGTHARFHAWLAEQTPQSVQQTLAFKRLNGEEFALPLWRALTHVLNHSTIHRGQLNSMLKLSGIEPPAVDYSSWARATGAN